MVPPTSILVFRNGSIGNTLVAVPAIRALRRSFPQAKMTAVVDPMGYALLKHSPWIDNLIRYDKRGDDRGLLANLSLVRRFRQLHPSHAVLFKRFFRNGFLAYLSGAPIRAGFVTEGKAPFLNLTIPYDETIHHVDMNLRLVEKLGAHSAGRELELTLSDEDRRAAVSILEAHRIEADSYLCAHYGGSTWFSEKCISTERFVELLSRLAGDRTVLLVGSGPSEGSRAKVISAQIPKAVSCCDLPVRTTAALIERAALFVGFNSGPSHLAAAVKTPLIMIFEPNEHTQAQIVRWLPPSEMAVPAVPPAVGSASDWEHFFEEVTSVAIRLRQSPQRIVS